MGRLLRGVGSAKHVAVTGDKMVTTEMNDSE